MQMLDLVDRPLPKPYRSNYAIAGKDYFLRLEAMRALRLAFGGDGDGFTRHEGPKVDYATLADDLGTGSLLGEHGSRWSMTPTPSSPKIGPPWRNSLRTPGEAGSWF